MDHDEFVEELMTNIDEAWGLSYVRALEQRLTMLGGTLAPFDGGQTMARADFIRAAEKHVTTDDVDDWNDMVDAWNRYIQVRQAAE